MACLADSLVGSLNVVVNRVKLPVANTEGTTCVINRKIACSNLVLFLANAGWSRLSNGGSDSRSRIVSQGAARKTLAPTLVAIVEGPWEMLKELPGICWFPVRYQVVPFSAR